jgi:hypothetical protein
VALFARNQNIARSDNLSSAREINAAAGFGAEPIGKSAHKRR